MRRQRESGLVKRWRGPLKDAREWQRPRETKRGGQGFFFLLFFLFSFFLSNDFVDRFLSFDLIVIPPWSSALKRLSRWLRLFISISFAVPPFPLLFFFHFFFFFAFSTPLDDGVLNVASYSVAIEPPSLISIIPFAITTKRRKKQNNKKKPRDCSSSTIFFSLWNGE